MTGNREELLRRRLSGRAGGRAVPPTAARRAERPELSFGQRRIWFVDQVQSDNAAYTIPIAYRVRGDLDVASLRDALATVVERHEALRTRLPAFGGEPYQCIEPAGPVLRCEDLSPETDPEALAAEIFAREADSSFDLDAGPLFRARLLRLARFDHVLLLTVHHSVFDGWSLGVLTRELSDAYAALHQGRRPQLSQVPLQYADFAAWQRAHLTADTLSRHLDYWRGKLAGAPALLELPTDRPRPEVPSHRGGAVRFTVPAETAGRLRELARSQSASLFVVTLAAYQVVLSRYTAMADLVVGVPVAGRDRRELEGLIGFFAHTLPLRADLGGDPSFARLVAQVRESALDGMSHQELPFEQLVEQLAPARELGRNPLVQVLFNLLTRDTGIEPDALVLTGLEVTDFSPGPVSTRFDLELHLFDHGSELTGRLIYAAELFDRTTMSWFTGHFLNALTAVAADPAIPVSAIPLITDAELDLIARWNAEGETR
ncbi:condensation domain-containing protein [Kitasatospora sp. NPDC056138]|uniref:condensation domain-containing protein n=1 Tax=Kitasatospora sp. NPDC056138 TaxID=3345724 RepID=UPI0035DE2781